MPQRKLGHLQQSVLELAQKNEGYVWADLIYQELFGHSTRAGDGTREPIDSSTRNSVSRVLWSLEKRGLLEKAADVRGFRLSDAD
jgi:hypothetical protein